MEEGKVVEVKVEEKAIVKAPSAPKAAPKELLSLPKATPITETRIKLSQGPSKAWPIEEEQVLEDGSKSQRYHTPSESSDMGRRQKPMAVLRRTCAPKDKVHGKPSVWWECEVNE